MNDLLLMICQALQIDADALSISNTVYVESERKVTFYFEASALLGFETENAIEDFLKKKFPSLRVETFFRLTALAAAFEREPMPFVEKSLMPQLCALHPAMNMWRDTLAFSVSGDTLLIDAKDSFCVQFFQERGIDRQIQAWIHHRFKKDLRVNVVLGTALDEAQERLDFLARQAKMYTPPKLKTPAAAKEQGPKPLLGRAPKGDVSCIADLTDQSGEVRIRGVVSGIETRELSGKEMELLTFVLSDETGSIRCKVFLRYRSAWGKKEDTPVTQEEIDRVKAVIKGVKADQGMDVAGSCAVDKFEHNDITVTIKSMMPYEIKSRTDDAARKRVELHAHSHMSNMDAVVSASDLIARAKAWGHAGIAITDSGVVQAFPEAFGAAKKQGIKLIPGMEGYMVDSADIVRHADSRPIDSPVVVFDFETTGLSPKHDRIIEIGAVKLVGSDIVDSFQVMVDPGRPLDEKIVEITGITDQMLIGQRKAEEVLPEFMAFVGDAVLAAHNAKFDTAFLKQELKRIGMSYHAPVLDTLLMAQKLYPEMSRYRLGTLCKALGVSLKNAHRAVHDAKATAECLAIMMGELKKQGAAALSDVNRLLPGILKSGRKHICLLAATQTGIQNLNRLVSIAHLEHFYSVPTLPKHIIQAHREGLLLGSACMEGELYQAVLDGADQAALEEIASFYDYLEVQPIDNALGLLHEGVVQSRDELIDINKTIIALGEKLGIPVAATGDVHYMDEKDKLFRTVLRETGNFRKNGYHPDVHFRTTEEMLAAFDYLPREKAEEIVIDVPNAILDRVDKVTLYPKHPEDKTTFSPVWETAEEDIRGMTMERAHQLYGDPLPDIIRQRLDKELKSIIGYGYATLYSIANKLVSNSLQNGYLVGSRGSVGSSLVATMCGITEVNPLPPHYVCPSCRYVEFDVPKEFKVGVDLPEKSCPHCGAALRRDGFDIPFEVFLGFKGDKVPDIDLNFSGDYQGKAHQYVETLFGKGYVFRAGTIGTLQEKTAFGLVSKYFEQQGKTCSAIEKARIAAGCVGVKRTTGQHPGGMVIVPKEWDISQFTAVQHPADKVDQGIVTTHFDFNSMHDILVKLDILGHDDPTIIHKLEELTGVPYSEISLSDQKVMSLFTSPQALGVTAEQIDCPTGTLGVPEFGTGFVRQMLLDTKPQTMEELIRISGLSHGTDVWLGNARDIIMSGTAKLKDCICIRDDIMNYLMSIGMPAKMSFDIMENVRKGKKLSPGPDMENAMLEHDVPAWFIESCKKIGYLFPKGHAVAYVTMALRIAWYKVYYPLAYYAAYFSIRCKAFDALTMVCPLDYAKKMLRDVKNKDESEKTAKDENIVVALEIVIEMLARGFAFLTPDLYKSDAAEFLVEGNALRCPFNALPGFGDLAAQSIVEARGEMPFLSVEDLKGRTKITANGVEMLRSCGGLRDLPATNQLSFL